MKNLKLFIVMFIFFFGDSHELTDEEVKERLIKFLMDCTKEISVDMKDLLDLEKLVPPTKPEVKCVLACAYKKAGTMNNKGLYDLEAGYRTAEMVRNGDEKREENARKLVDICAKVNDEEVSDGEQGCERAALLYKCFTENAPQLGFKID